MGAHLPDGLGIRPERLGDGAAIHQLTKTAFAPMAYSDGSEPQIIDTLRSDGDLLLSLIAFQGADIVGHIAFSPVAIGPDNTGWVGLGPVSVAPTYQRQGIGAALITMGLSHFQKAGARGCVLVGDPAYYHRFGFVSSGRLSYAGLDRSFVQHLAFDGSDPVGELNYAPAFGG